jgi:hypothetical protein
MYAIGAMANRALLVLTVIVLAIQRLAAEPVITPPPDLSKRQVFDGGLLGYLELGGYCK